MTKDFQEPRKLSTARNIRAEDEGFIPFNLGNSPFQTPVRVAIALIFFEV